MLLFRKDGKAHGVISYDMASGRGKTYCEQAFEAPPEHLPAGKKRSDVECVTCHVEIDWWARQAAQIS